MTIAEPIFWSNFINRTDLTRFKENALLLYAFDIRFDIEDIASFASENIVGGGDDKKCDLVFVDYDTKTAIVVQSYVATRIKQSAPSNKASDLNTAAGWLLSEDILKVPSTIRDSAVELRSAISDNLIDKIEFWYLHNCHESKNVEDELRVVARTVSNALKTHFPENPTIGATTDEIGIETIQEWYNASKATILVTDTLTIDIPGGYTINEGDWESFSTSVQINWLRDISLKYKKSLFSANVRDYLGSRNSDANINNGIKLTAEKQPEMFWVYNNGITAIVNGFKPILAADGKTISRLQIDGISIVNGAQTTGALGTLPIAPKESGLVVARFIKSSNQATVRNIIRFNNSQNKISPSDFRSTDQYQDKLRREFDRYKTPMVYTGGRRGGDDDKIKRPQNFLPFEKVTQSLAAFHQYPGMAYQSKKELWESDLYYSKIFNSETTAGHIVFVYSLFKHISDYKLALMAKLKAEGQLIDDEELNLSFLRKRASNYVLIAGIAASLEIITGRPVPSKFSYQFNDSPSIDDGVLIWTPVVKSLISFNGAFSQSLESQLKNADQVQIDIDVFKSFVSSTKGVMHEVYSEFSKSILI